MVGILCTIAGMGGGAVTFPLPSPTNVLGIDTAPSYASYGLLSNGNVETDSNSTGSAVIGQWIVPATTAADYEVRATLTGGSLTSGTTGSYISLGSTRTWRVEANSPGSNQGANLTIEIRLTAGPGPVVATALVSIQADYL
jgi:hypothetical protein